MFYHQPVVLFCEPYTKAACNVHHTLGLVLSGRVDDHLIAALSRQLKMLFHMPYFRSEYLCKNADVWTYMFNRRDNIVAAQNNNLTFLISAREQSLARAFCIAFVGKENYDMSGGVNRPEGTRNILFAY
jgi:hypothetical protein